MYGAPWEASVERIPVVILKDGRYSWYQAYLCQGRRLHHKGPLNSYEQWSYDQIMEIREGKEWKIITECSWFRWGGEDNRERKIQKRISETRGNEAEVQKRAKLSQRNKGIGLRAFKYLDNNLTFFFSMDLGLNPVRYVKYFTSLKIWKFNKALLNSF